MPPITLALDQLPLYIAIGFITGHVIAKPLLMGFLAKAFFIDPLFALYKTTYGSVYDLYYLNLTPTAIEYTEFSLAFCSGMIVYGALVSVWDLCLRIFSFKTGTSSNTNYQFSTLFPKKFPWIQVSFVLTITTLFLTHFQFPWFVQVYLLACTVICIYQMLTMAGKMGIVPLGRFATFVMIPGMLLFKLDPVQITLIAAFVEIGGGVASSVLFGRRLARLSAIDNKRIATYQWLGLIISSAVIGIIFWLFIGKFGLGHHTQLPVTKAASRALLINCKNFDLYILLCGILFGGIAQKFKINHALLLGGILMPPSISLPLIAGGILPQLTKSKELYYPSLSGIAAGNSVFMLAKILFT